MIIILEGPDGAGKSTLAGSLVKDLNAEYYHSGGPKTPQELELVTNELEIMAHSSRTYIVDRAPWISEIVYGYALKRHSLVSPQDHLDCLKIPQKIVFCRPSGPMQMKLDFKAHKPKDHTEGVIKNHEKIIDMYDQIFKKIPHIKYDYKKSDYSHLLKQLGT